MYLHDVDYGHADAFFWQAVYSRRIPFHGHSPFLYPLPIPGLCRLIHFTRSLDLSTPSASLTAHFYISCSAFPIVLLSKVTSETGKRSLREQCACPEEQHTMMFESTTEASAQTCAAGIALREERNERDCLLASLEPPGHRTPDFCVPVAGWSIPRPGVRLTR